GTFVFTQGWVVLMPFILLGAWRVRGGFVAPMLLFALGIHAAMTLVFAFPGWRGGLLHGAVALLPWWAACATVGLDAAVDWVAKRRRRWNARTAKRVFAVGVVLLALLLTGIITNSLSRADPAPPALYAQLQPLLPSGSRVLINDPSALYYYTGLGGAVLPNESPETLLSLAQQFGITHLVLEDVQTLNGQMFSASAPALLQPLLDQPPSFLVALPAPSADVRIYRFTVGD
ncbi:MAG: hypothetical protein H7Y11_15475, partial [Armatimonadetes bacterium]|nr:hypothetical protein [Anaerolineae bacterium]